MSTLRLFAAIELPSFVVDDLARATAPLRDDTLSWTDTPAWHVTLAFYGAVDEALVPSLQTRLQRAGARCPVLELRLSGAGRFGHRVLWAGVAGDRDVLRGLAAAALAAGRRTGIAVEEGRTYRPHVTLARSTADVDLRPYVAALADHQGAPWAATDLALVRSHLGGGEGRRARYETVDRFPLRAAPPVRSTRRRPRRAP
jgi:2'-5' RNA ligase